MHYRRATHDDTGRIMEIIGQAQAQMRTAGSQQWQNGYPAPRDIERDIDRGWGMVAYEPGTKASSEASGVAHRSDLAVRGFGLPHAEARAEAADPIAAYAAVVFDGEPAYTHIRGAWLSNGPYVVVHRLAVADGMKGRGLATAFMRRIEQEARERGVFSFRVDTNFDNGYMHRMLATLGFTHCGAIDYEGAERLAYEKILNREDQ